MSKKGLHMSSPSKMPCHSFDLSVILSGCAARCIYGITNICYVLTNFHDMEWNKNRQNVFKRNQKLLESKRFTHVMINELLEDGDRWFRFFASGDFPDIESMHKIMDACRAIDIGTKKFWIPTSREDLLEKYLTTGNKIPDNVCIRMSSPVIGDATIPQLPYLEKLFKENGVCYSATTMDKSKVTCHASLEKKGNCGTCRKCWDKSNKLVVYFIHNTTSVKRAKEYFKSFVGFGDGVTVP